MIQDIAPAYLDNAYREISPDASDAVLCFEEDRILAGCDAGGESLFFPVPAQVRGKFVYAFSIGEKRFFLALEAERLPEDFPRYSLRELREMRLRGNEDIFAVYTAYHLWKWYETSRFCGACGSVLDFDRRERAKVCPACGNRVYPRINPAVIVGVIDGDRLLITRYKSGFRHNALIAGFTEIGETAEQTASREVREEVGLQVKNLRYYQSQPWGIASDLLMGFFCEVDGDPTIRRDDSELGYAEWVRREEIVLQPSDYSLTNQMMKIFRDGKMNFFPGP